jgi:hypothetical protein
MLDSVAGRVLTGALLFDAAGWFRDPPSDDGRSPESGGTRDRASGGGPRCD